MSAGAADRRNPSAGDTLRLSAVGLPEGATSIARYKILSELGVGAMGKVYLALDPNIDRKVAIKVLQPRGVLAATDMEELRVRFLLEARAAGRLRHPGAVAIYDADHDPESGLSYIAMEWVDGHSLEHVIKESGQVPIEQTLTIMKQVAGALDAAHRQGLIHRDVKPANILLDREGNAKLSDFGIAKLESLELTSTGQVLGTPYYMSPEQIRDEPLDGRSDQFSLGVVLYQCVTGQLPFRADSLPALTHKILHVDPRPPVEHNPTLPESLVAVLARSLAKHPDDRFGSMEEFSDALDREAHSVTSTIALTHSAMPAPTALDSASSSPTRTWSWGRASLLLVVLTILALVGSNWRRETTTAAARPTAADRQTAKAPVAAATREVQAPATVATTTLQISYTNRLRSAQFTVWVDGEKVLDTPVSRRRGLLNRAVGTRVFESVALSPGHHDIQVSIEGVEGKIVASNRTGGQFDDGQTRRLRVELIPPSYLNLSWKDP